MFKLILPIAALLIASTVNAAEHEVVQENKLFNVTEMTIAAGDTIIFKNQDSTTHNLYSLSPGNNFNIKKQSPGEDKAVTLSTPGKVKIRCAIHPKMKLVVMVQ